MVALTRIPVVFFLASLMATAALANPAGFDQLEARAPVPTPAPVAVEHMEDLAKRATTTTTKTATPSIKLTLRNQKRSNMVCDTGYTQCPVKTRGSKFTKYECVETDSNLESCGGCPFEDLLYPGLVPLGEDCTAIPNATWLGCEIGRCIVKSCTKGFVVGSDGRSCVAAPHHGASKTSGKKAHHHKHKQQQVISN